jgi:hypothetical protein
LFRNHSLISLLVIAILISIWVSPLQSSAGIKNPLVHIGANTSGVSDEEKSLEEQQSTGVNVGSGEQDEGREEANTTGLTTGPGSAPSDLIPENQPAATNNTEETSKPKIFARQLSPDLLKDFQALTPPPPYKVRVTFESMKVHNDHEGLLSGDGEYDIVVYVQGKKVALTDLSGPGDGLWDVSSGETVTFEPSAQAMVEIVPPVPLSIFTVGSEVDGCDRTAFPENIQDQILRVLTLGGALKPIQNKLNDAINWVGCKLNPNDVLGVLDKVYEPTGYGAGTHQETSDSGDFTLSYTISVTAPPTSPAPAKGQTAIDPNVLEQLQKGQTLQTPDESLGNQS